MWAVLQVGCQPNNYSWPFCFPQDLHGYIQVNMLTLIPLWVMEHKTNYTELSLNETKIPSQLQAHCEDHHENQAYTATYGTSSCTH